MDDNKQMLQYINACMLGKEDCLLSLDTISPSNRELAEGIQALVTAVKETTIFATHIANGNLSESPNRSNMLLGPLRDLQSSLRHMLWQVSCVSEGNYNQSVVFLGEFSVVFNALAEQIKLREMYQQKTAKAEKHIMEQKKLMLEKQLEQQITHYQSLQEVYQQVRSFRHDMNNHCLSLDRLLAAGEVKRARVYIDSMSAILKGNDDIVNTGNPLFDAILSEKITVAREKGFPVEVQISVPEQVQVNDFDWCVLLGNAFDNAIEACMNLQEEKERAICFKAKYHKGMLNVMIRNTAVMPQAKGDGTYKTTKPDSQNHGLGLENMTHIVEQYEGVLQTNYQEGIFTLTFMLCNV